MEEQPEVYKELVIGYVVTEIKSENRKAVYSKPIVTANAIDYRIQAMEDCDYEISQDEKVVGVIPAPFPTYCVNAVAPSGQIFVLGYEHPNLPPQDWKVAYEQAMKCKAYYGIGESTTHAKATGLP